MPRKTREKDALCEGCNVGVPHLLHYSSKGTPVERWRPRAESNVQFVRKPEVFLECAHGVPNGDCWWTLWSNDRSLTDTQFGKKARAMGWSILPTRCPQHRFAPLAIEADPLLALLVGEEAQ